MRASMVGALCLHASRAVTWTCELLRGARFEESRSCGRSRRRMRTAALMYTTESGRHWLFLSFSLVQSSFLRRLLSSRLSFLLLCTDTALERLYAVYRTSQLCLCSHPMIYSKASQVLDPIILINYT